MNKDLAKKNSSSSKTNSSKKVVKDRKCRQPRDVTVILGESMVTLHKKWISPLRISSVNVTKPAFYCRFGHNLLKKSLIENFIFCALSKLWKVWSLQMSQTKLWSFSEELTPVKWSDMRNQLRNKIQKTFEND